MTITENDNYLSLRLTRAEALVLFEWLTGSDTVKNMPFDDPAEQHVLWRIEGQLESTLIEPLGTDYKLAVKAAREEIRRSNCSNETS
jgi:hypothetical protein